MHVYKGQLSINLKTEQHSIYRDIQRFLLQQIYYQVPLSVDKTINTTGANNFQTTSEVLLLVCSP